MFPSSTSNNQCSCLPEQIPLVRLKPKQLLQQFEVLLYFGDPFCQCFGKFLTSHAVQVAGRPEILSVLLQLVAPGNSSAPAAATALLNLSSNQAVATSLIRQPGSVECITKALAGDHPLVATHCAGTLRPVYAALLHTGHAEAA